MNTESIDNLQNILFDFSRTARIGIPEAVFCEGKPIHILRQLLQKFKKDSSPILFTRLKENIFNLFPEDLRLAYDYDPISETAFAAKMPPHSKGSVAVISAGSADTKVAKEAGRTLEFMGINHCYYEDCGISALWRITQRIKKINEHDVLIVIAGMEGALASVLGGLSPKPIYAVPSSIGYGISHGGKAALSGMLASCAPGIGVLNIDNGYGAACAATRIINLL